MTSAVVSGIAAVGTLFANPSGKMFVITSILIFAIADNIADTFGMHMYQDAELLKGKQVWLSTAFNYGARFITSLVFIAILFIFPPFLASVICIAVGLLLLTIISYAIARQKKADPILMIIEHVGLAIGVLILSTIAGNIIRSQLR